MKKLKKLLPCLVPLAVFAVYFVLSLSCATTSNNVVRGTGNEVDVYPITTVNSSEKYDLTLLSAEDCPSRILKVVSKDEEANVYYTISKPGDTKVVIQVGSGESASKKELPYNVVTDSELDGKYFLNEQDAKDAIEFINQLEDEFRQNRYEEGVLNKFEVHRKYTEQVTVWVVDEKRSDAYGSSEFGHYETREVTKYHRVLFIQHSTVAGEDTILYSANDSELVKVSLAEILSVRDALSK